MPAFYDCINLYINLLNLSWTIKCLFLRNMEPLIMLCLCNYCLNFFVVCSSELCLFILICVYNLYVLIMLLFQHLLFICLNSCFPAAYLTASIGFLNSTIHDEGPET